MWSDLVRGVHDCVVQLVVVVRGVAVALGRLVGPALVAPRLVRLFHKASKTHKSLQPACQGPLASSPVDSSRFDPQARALPSPPLPLPPPRLYMKYHGDCGLVCALCVCSVCVLCVGCVSDLHGPHEPGGRLVLLRGVQHPRVVEHEQRRRTTGDADQRRPSAATTRAACCHERRTGVRLQARPNGPRCLAEGEGQSNQTR
jgi:hypothetical protein